MATIDDDLAKAVTEGFRQAQIDVVNQDLILSGTGDVTVTLADGSKKTGPSWSKLITAANAAGTSAAAAKTSETNAGSSATSANSSKNAAANSASAADASKTNAKTSETNAKTSETNAKTSETNAKTSETNAAASLAAAQLLTSVPYEDSPYPDVWAPLNDSLKLDAGFAPFDKATISGQVLELATKSIPFTRASTATYIDKSGVLQVAAINEPRFGRDGIKIEGQASNFILNSDDATKWNTSSSVTKTVLAKDGSAQAPTMKGVMNLAQNIPTFLISSDVTLAIGETITCSFRAKGTYGNFRVNFTRPDATAAAAVFDAQTAQIRQNPADMTCNTSLGSDGYTTGSFTITALTAGVHTVRIMGQYAVGDTLVPVGSEFYIQMPQLEKTPIASSYIPTGAAVVTRAFDLLDMPLPGNIGYRVVGDTFARTLAMELTIDQFVQPTPPGYVNVIYNVNASLDLILRAQSDRIISYRSSGGAAITTTYPFYKKMFVQTIDVANNNQLKTYFDGKTATGSGAPPTPDGTGTVLRFGGNSNMVYHIRNFRIWHRLLTLNQINGLR